LDLEEAAASDRPKGRRKDKPDIKINLEKNKRWGCRLVSGVSSNIHCRVLCRQ